MSVAEEIRVYEKGLVTGSGNLQAAEDTLLSFLISRRLGRECGRGLKMSSAISTGLGSLLGFAQNMSFQEENESQDLERQNAALRREIKQLSDELKHFSAMLTSHETHCSILHTQPPAPTEVLFTPLPFPQTHISAPCFQH
ncbi:basic leucine zipper transcriptional factor ATF-like isoform X1 [Podarcis muralis]